MLTFLTVGDWLSGHVTSSWKPSRASLAPELQQRIEQTWQRASSRPGIHLFDGPMCRLDEWRATTHSLELTLSPTSYKQFLGTNMADPASFPAEALANPVGLSPALLTADGYLMLGHRSAAVAYYPGRIHPFAGALEPTDPTVFAGISRELREELSLQPHELAGERCIGMIEDQRLRQPEVIFSIQTTRTRDELAKALEKLEHRSCVAIKADEEEIERALANPALTPVALGTLLLFGRRELGERWFDRHRLSL